MKYKLSECVLLEYSRNSLQVDLPGDVAATVLGVAARIPDEHLAGKGREGHPHMTLRYGVSDRTPEILTGLLRARSIKLKLGPLRVFPPNSHTEGAAVVYFSVLGDLARLRDLRARISALAGEGPENFSDWVPHVTVAYVRPEVANQYDGLNFEDGPKNFQVGILTFSRREDHPEGEGMEGVELC